ncbi:hypothetical protein [Vibrio navarrensis]|uniref:hypothetical protein n=1 Tax=Vibrio navarrensis TaxID=29495 RepID=UPI0015591201|nr:hypothetical protein [Vibrio navarrensis]
MSVRIGYVIFNLGVGKGGHSLSLSELIKARDSECSYVVNISNHDCEVLKEIAGVNYFNVKPSIFIFPTIIRLRNIFSSNRLDLIHAFDEFSYALSILSSSVFLNIPLLMTKCGGPNPTSAFSFPKPKNLILYSKENLEWFNLNNTEVNCYLIPNRIGVLNTTISKEIEEIVVDYSFNIVCISRITTFYEKKLKGAVLLLNRLRSFGVEASLTFIGNVESRSLLERLSDDSGHIKFLCDDFHTIKSSQFIHYFDATISTGRGAMESILSKKHTFVPTVNDSLPVLVNIENVNNFSSSNFSERSVVPEPLGNGDFQPYIFCRTSFDEKLLAYANKNFSVYESLGIYEEIYEEVMSSNRKTNIYFSDVLCVFKFGYRILSQKLGFGIRGRFR